MSKGMRLLTVNRKTYSSNVGKCEMVRALTVTYKHFCLHVCKLIKLCHKENFMHHNYFCCCVQGTLDYSIASQLHFVNTWNLIFLSKNLYVEWRIERWRWCCIMHTVLVFAWHVLFTACQIKSRLWHFPRTLLLWIPICDNILSTVSDNALSTIFIHYKWKLV